MSRTTEQLTVVGAFLTAWVDLEKLLNSKSSDAPGSVLKPGTLDMVMRLTESGSLSAEDAAEIDALRTLRNKVAHGMSDDKAIEDQKGLERLKDLIRRLRSAWDAT